MEKGYRVYSKEKTLNLEDKHGKVVASVEMAPNRMFKMNIGSFEAKCLKVNCQGQFIRSVVFATDFFFLTKNSQNTYICQCFASKWLK